MSHLFKTSLPELRKSEVPRASSRGNRLLSDTSMRQYLLILPGRANIDSFIFIIPKHKTLIKDGQLNLTNAVYCLKFLRLCMDNKNLGKRFMQIFKNAMLALF